jgi:hypothetical protein
MPWAWHMERWCWDPIASSLAGHRKYKIPYPGRNWYEDWIYNKFLIEAMRAAHYADLLFSKRPEQWSDSQRMFYRQMQEGLNA